MPPISRSCSRRTFSKAPYDTEPRHLLIRKHIKTSTPKTDTIRKVEPTRTESRRSPRHRPLVQKITNSCIRKHKSGLIRKVEPTRTESHHSPRHHPLIQKTIKPYIRKTGTILNIDTIQEVEPTRTESHRSPRHRPLIQITIKPSIQKNDTIRKFEPTRTESRRSPRHRPLIQKFTRPYIQKYKFDTIQEVEPTRRSLFRKVVHADTIPPPLIPKSPDKFVPPFTFPHIEPPVDDPAPPIDYRGTIKSESPLIRKIADSSEERGGSGLTGQIGGGEGRRGRRSGLGYGSSHNSGENGSDQKNRYCWTVTLTREPLPVSEYQPAEVSMETLRGNGPALASGPWGMSEIVEERLARIEEKMHNIARWMELWAKKMVAADYVLCPPNGWNAGKHWAEQSHAVARGQRQRHSSFATSAASAYFSSFSSSSSSSWDTADDSNNSAIDDFWNKQPHIFTEEQKDALVRKLVGGSYEIIGIGSENMISRENWFVEQVLQRHAARNETYFSEDVEALVKKARMLVQPPNDRARG